MDFPKVTLAKSMEPPCVATTSSCFNSSSNTSTSFLDVGSTDTNSPAIAFWISNMALTNFPVIREQFVKIV